jgi:replicative superfamily II helicase
MIKARFVGIDRHIDPKISDLKGAARDATALWALFSDTLQDADCKLLLNQEATAENIRRAIDETLGSAKSDDLVILTFAGHGTHDHRLVAHDTAYSNYNASTIAMSDLARQFKGASARAVICILDCCFSGGAPARVLNDSPTSRDLPFDHESFSGSGCLMITAAGLDEAAYEHPTRHHGLLTNALIDVLTQTEGAVSLTAAFAKAQDIIRADAASMGVTQTPILFGKIDGGLTIPTLHRGDKFLDAFPETIAVHVSADIYDLAAAGMPKAVLDAWAECFPEGLNSLQIRAVNEYRVLDRASVLVVAPTSSGKTFVGEMAAIRAISEGRKVVFLLPYRALVNEKYEDFDAIYAERLCLRVIRCCGDYLDQTGDFLRGKFDIAILTFEMFLSLAIGHQPVLNYLGLVVLDEAQFIADTRRGISVELLLTYLRAARQWGIQPQLVLLSATIGDLNHFHEWLAMKALISDSRPVPLEVGVLDRSGTYEYLSIEGEHLTRQLLPSGLILQRRDHPSSQDVIVPLVRELLTKQNAKEKILIFRNQRGSAEGCANYLAKELGLLPATSITNLLPTYDTSNASSKLRQALGGGTAFHDTNLIRDERIIVERAFRDPDSPVKVLAATTGVAAGVNTPASTVIIVEHDFPWEGTSLSAAEVKNMAGRAGRLGFQEKGTAIILAESPLQRQELFRRYVLAGPEPVTSSFKEENIGTWILRLLAQIQCIQEDELVSVIANTYGGYLRALSDPVWQKRQETQLLNLVPRMLADGLLERNKNKLSLTLLGRACGASSLTLESALQLVEILRNMASTGIPPEKLMALVQALPELDARYTPLFRSGQRELKWDHEAAIRFGNDTVVALQRRVADSWMYHARTKRACILWDWINGMPINEMEKKYTINSYQGSVSGGDIRAISDITRFHLRSAFQIASVLAPANTPDPEVMDALLRQLETGIPVKALDLLHLPVPLVRGEYLALIEASVTKVSEVWIMPPDRIETVLGTEHAEQLERHRPTTS